MTRPTIASDLEVVVRGELPTDIVDYARDRITSLGEHLSEPVFHTRVRLTHEPNPAFDRPVLAQANVSLKGRMVRAQVAGFTGPEAVDRLRDRLQRSLARDARHWEARRGGRPGGDQAEWRHTGEPTQRPRHFVRPAEERQLIRHKSFTPRRINPDEAIWDMDRLDYTFHLFTDAQTARDAVVWRDSADAYHLRRVAAGPEPSVDQPPVELDPTPAPTLSIDEARRTLEDSGLPFVFFVERGSSCGAILYWRYDGHYGLITPPR